MTRLVDVVIARREKQKEYFENYLGWAEKIKQEATGLLGDIRVIVFGSVLRSEETPRDIDLLVISPKLDTTEKKRALRMAIWGKIGFHAPFELHFATPEIYQDWYRRLIGAEYKEI